MDSLLELFCDVDDFCKAFLPFWNQHLLASGQKQRQLHKNIKNQLMTMTYRIFLRRRSVIETIIDRTLPPS